MNSLLTPNLGIIFLFTVLAMVIVLLITVLLPAAKRKTGLNFVYLLIAGILIGSIGILARHIDNAFYFYLVLLFWYSVFGSVHVILFDKILEWPSGEKIGWRLLYTFSIVLSSLASLLSFMQLGKYDFMNFYNISASTVFFVPLLLVFSFECYLLIPAKVFLEQKPWIYNRTQELIFRNDEVSGFYLIKYRLTPYTGGDRFDSLVMRAPNNIKLGDYFNSTLEVQKVRQGHYSIESRDQSNKSYGWFFFLADGSVNGRMLDPNKNMQELGFTKSVFYGHASSEQIDKITKQAEQEGKCYTIICKREHEYKSQLV